MNYESIFDFDISVRKIVHLINRVTDASWTYASFSTSDSRYILCLALSGEATYQFEDKSIPDIPVKKGDLIFFPNNSRRTAQTNPADPWHYITIGFEADAYNQHSREQLNALPLITHNVPSSIVNNFMEMNRTWTGKGSAHILKCRSLLESVLYDLFNLNLSSAFNSVHFKKIEAARQYIQDHFNQPISIQELAETADYSPNHFRILFKNIVGMTPLQYATMIRIYKAQDLLAYENMNVSEAAAYTGYNDISYFSRQFKAITGFPPSHYLK